MFEFEKHLQTFALPAAVCCCPMVCTMLHSFVLLRRLIEKLLKFYSLFITLTTSDLPDLRSGSDPAIFCLDPDPAG